MTALFIVGVILLLLVLDIVIVQRFEGLSGRQVSERLASLLPSIPALSATPGLFYGRGHTSVRVAENGEARIALDGFARHALGRIEGVELPRPGMQVKRGDPLITAVRDGRRLVFSSPLTGTVAAVRPENANGEDRDWILSLSPRRLGGEIGSLFVAEKALAWLRTEFDRFREFVVDGFRADPAMATLPDGGTPAEGALALLPEEQWHEFEDEFLAAEVAK